MGSFDDTSKIRRALKKNTPAVLDDSGMQSISAKKPEATGWHHPGNAPNLSPYGFASLPFDKFAKKLPNIFKDWHIIFVDNIIAYPPGCQPVLPGFCLYSMLYFLVMWPKTFTFWCSLCFISFFCKVRKKVAGEPFSGAARRIARGEKALVPVQAAKIDFRALPPCAGGVHRV